MCEVTCEVTQKVAFCVRGHPRGCVQPCKIKTSDKKFRLGNNKRHPLERLAISYNNVVGGQLKLKGKALDVKAGDAKKKSKLQQIALHADIPIVDESLLLSVRKLKIGQRQKQER